MMQDGTSLVYYVRALQLNLRIGIATKSVMTSLAQAFVGKEASKAQIAKAVASMDRATSLVASIPVLVDTLSNSGLEGLDRLEIVPLCPVTPMLAKATKSIDDVFAMTKQKDFVVEYKYDGERMQFHMDGTVEPPRSETFSRSLERTTEKFDRFADIIRAQLTVDSVILDGEIVAIDKETFAIKSF